MKMSKVSIIVMCYKNEKNLLKTINSILMQRYKEYQIIISDDCSPAFDKVLLEQIEKNLTQQNKEYLININKQNLGTVKHFNNLIKLSDGNIIVPLSCGDEFYNESVLEKIVENFKKNEFLVATGRREACIDGKTKIMPSDQEVNVLKLDNGSIVNYICRYFNLISGSCTYYRRDVFEKYGYFDESYTLLEDCPYFLKLLTSNEKLGFIDQICIKYEMDGVSTGSMHPLLKNDFHKLFKNIKSNYYSKLNYLTKRFINYRINAADKGLLCKLRYFDVLSILVYNSIKNK